MSVQELASWVRNPQNGLVDSVESGSLVLTMQYLPVEFLNAVKAVRVRSQPRQDNKSDDGKTRDELAVFELTIALRNQDGHAGQDGQEVSTQDPVFAGVSSLESFTERVRTLAFTIQDHVRLFIDGRERECVSASLQQDMGLRAKRAVRLIFKASEASLAEAQNVAIEWSDIEYGTGRHSFQCHTGNVRRMPKANTELSM